MKITRSRHMKNTTQFVIIAVLFASALFLTQAKQTFAQGADKTTIHLDGQNFIVYENGDIIA